MAGRRTTPTPEAVEAAARALGAPLPHQAAAPLAAYLDLLQTYNAKMNLVGPARWEEVFDTLVVDSLHLAGFLDSLGLPDDPLCLDLGAGAGLPGVPLRTVWPRGQYWMVEVRQKRAVFIQQAVGRLKLARTGVLSCRAEEALARLDAPGADLVVSRAFMPWEKLAGFVRPMLAPGGRLVVLSNDPAPAPDALNAAAPGWRVEAERSYPVPAAEGAARYFWSLSPPPAPAS